MVLPSNQQSNFRFSKDTLLALYFKDIGKSKALDRSEERSLLSRIRQGDRKALNALLNANLKFVVSVSHHYRNRGMPLPDLISEGNLGLIRAALRFDETQDFKFISYAVWWIRQAILTALARQPGAMTISTFQAETLKKIHKACHQVTHLLGREPRAEDLTKATGLPVSTIESYAQLSGIPLGCNASASREESGDLESISGDDGTGPEQEIDHRLLGKDLDGVMACLGERGREILKMYFGVGYSTRFSLGEIGRRFQISREGVRQIKNTSLKKLRHPSRMGNLHHFGP